MGEGGHTPRAVRFGPFHLDLVTGELLRAGVPQHLQVQPFRVLAALIARPGELVTRDDLRATLWPNDVFVDVEHGLNVVIAKLRHTLSDNVESPHFIETLERRGYRFLAPVEPVGPPPAHHASPDGPIVYVTVGEETVALGVGEHVVGRDPFCAVWIDSRIVSRRHASIAVTPDGVAIDDLGSRNGTFVNGRRVCARTILAEGDDIRLGTLRVIVHAHGSADSTSVDGGLQLPSS